MIVKCTYCGGELTGDAILVNIPNTETYEFVARYSYDMKDDDGLFFCYGNKEIPLRDIDYWTQGRPNLDGQFVHELYTDIVEEICNIITDNPNALIDIDKIEQSLLDKEYWKKWCDRGYIDENEREYISKNS